MLGQVVPASAYLDNDRSCNHLCDPKQGAGGQARLGQTRRTPGLTSTKQDDMRLSLKSFA